MHPRTLVFLCALSARAHAAGNAAFHVNYATYLGGSLDDQARAVAVDAAGNAYVAGTTSSPDFPLTSLIFGAPSKDHPCSFVTKLSAAGDKIIWSVCLAGSTVRAIQVDPIGNVYVLTVDASANSFAAKLNPTADSLLYSKALSASADAIAVDPGGNLYVAGTAGETFKATPGAYQPKLTPGTCHGGAGVGLIPYPCFDGFVMKLNTNGDVVFATFLGGSNTDECRAIAVNSRGEIWVTGDTVSPDFPVTANALQTTFHGEVDLGPLKFGDAFVAKLDATGSQLLYSTYVGGAQADLGLAIALDRLDNAYVAGGTQSSDFPTTQAAFQRAYGGSDQMPGAGGDAFLAKWDDFGLLIYSTFVGGPLGESANQLGVDSQGNAYLNAYPNTSTQNQNTFSVLNPSGSAILHSATIAGSFAVTKQGSVYFAGSTLGHVFFPSDGAYQSKFAGGTYDAMVVSINFGQPASPWITNIVNAASLRSGTNPFYPAFDVAPGELITIFGSGFDPQTQVFFDGLPAPVIYVQQDQINAVVPFEIKGPATAITFGTPGHISIPGMFDVFDAVPGVFTLNGSGQGHAAILNQDGTVNSSSHPAAPGSVISVFITGAGRMTPAQQDGSVTPLTPPFPIPVLGVGCNLGQVLYAGAAPGLVAGVVQVNILLSNDLHPSGEIPVTIYIGNYATGSNTTIATR